MVSIPKLRYMSREDKKNLEEAIEALVNQPNGIAGVAADGLIPSSLYVSGIASGGSVVLPVDFGSTFSHFAQGIAVEQAWVSAASVITVTPIAATGKDMETALFQFSWTIGSIVNADGFTLSVYTPVKAKGIYNFHCVGV